MGSGVFNTIGAGAVDEAADEAGTLGATDDDAEVVGLVPDASNRPRDRRPMIAMPPTATAARSSPIERRRVERSRGATVLAAISCVVGTIGVMAASGTGEVV